MARTGTGGLTFHHPAAFWLATAAVTAGVLLHLPMYVGARDMEYHLAGMAVDAPMKVGMVLVLAGVAAAAYGLFPPLSARRAAAPVRVRALDDAKLSRAHVGLLLVLAGAVTIDVMKPVTLSFVVPGMALAYVL